MSAREQAARIKRELKEVGKQIRQLDKGARKSSRRRAAQGEHSLQRLVVLAVYIHGQQALDLAAQCWCTDRRHRGCEAEDTSLDRAKMVVGSWVAAATPAEWQALQRPVQPQIKKAVAKARKFLADASAAVWALACNVGKGHAPTTQQLWHHSAPSRIARLTGEAERSAAASASTLRMWAWRWRRRWFFKYGKIRTREQYDVPDLRRKVGAPEHPKRSIC